ncbi:MAG: SRPBCC domain-containing protein [Deltaproteobacteria bacterium HGW-Deltaproteobacteria-4]|nr:MAG: SRPBCC domain-containing protein [Deltaproteobacteria bacterium HGW-Deltaproteobacteria-4]
MKRYTIRHEVGIKAAPSAVYQALTEREKLAGWWTADTRGRGTAVGDVLEFWFGEYCKKFAVIELQRERLVRWQARDGDHEWDGTEITFVLRADDQQCRVDFSHSGWRREDGWLPHTSTKWAVFLLSLKDLLEKGKGQPAPDDVQVNHD